MNQHDQILPPQRKVIRLEVSAEEEQTADIADIDEVRRSLVLELRNNGYSVTPSPSSTGVREKGVGPAFDVLIQIPKFLHDNKDLLLEIFDSIILTLQCILITREKRSKEEKEKREPLKITLKIDGKPVTIESSDAKNAATLLEHFVKTHPSEAKKITSESNLEIDVKVPTRKRHRPRSH